ncbi:MAG: VOC family protein [Bacteroidetes bacterium]|nr:MAG: VOC family protein [Bacteroidota bacterium]
MTTVNTYLTFNGNCETAFNFYKAAFGVEFEMVSKFKDMPPDPNLKISDEDKEKIMHVSMPIGNTVLMGSDTGGELANGYKAGNNFSVSINAGSKDEAERLFNVLSENGQIMMPMDKTFWGSYFGMFTDQYGIQWMVSFSEGK